MNIIICPHPDDELLGTGGILLKKPDDFMVVYVTGGDAKRDYQRNQFINEAGIKAKIIGLTFSSLDDRLAFLVSVLTDLPFAESVFIPSCNDYHSDHRVLYQACRTVFKPWKKKANKLLCYEVLSETPSFEPNVFVEINGALKRNAMEKYYPGECIGSRNGAAIEALATLRGAQSGLTSAEAFRLEYDVTR